MTAPGKQPAALPVGVREGLQRLDEGLAACEADAQALLDLLGHNRAPESAISYLKRKKGLLGHLREDLRDLPERIGGSS